MSNNSSIYILGTGAVSPNGIQQEAFSLKENRPTQSDVAGLADYIAKRSLRRIDHFSRLALYASCLALDDAGLWGTDVTNTGIALTSGYGAAQTTFNFLDSFLDHGDRLASPTHFSSGLHNAASAYISMHTKAQGPCACTSNIGLGTAYSLASAIYWLQEGIVDYALVGGVDEHCQVLKHCVSRFQSDAEKNCFLNEFSATEGAAFLVLGRQPSPKHPATCVVLSPEVGQYTEDTFNTIPEHLHMAPLGLTRQQLFYNELSAKGVASNTLLQIGSHPSALAFASVNAAQSILNGDADKAHAFALDQLDKFSLISFTS